MPFSEEVPKDRKCRCGCKRRNCEMQRLLKLDDGKVVFTYECMSPTIWRTCARCIDPDMPKVIKTDTATSKNILKDITESEPKSQTSQKSQEAKPFKCPHEGCKFSASTEFLLNKHLDSIHHSQQPTVQEQSNP